MGSELITSNHYPDQPYHNEGEHHLRDLFVQEYLVDYDAEAACRRVGFIGPIATQYAKLFMQEPYVRRQIVKAEEEADISSPEAVQRTQSRIVHGLLREANYFGPDASPASRVSALNSLAKIYKLESMQTNEEEGTKGGVMVIGQVYDVDAWEVAAMDSQQRLKDDVKN